MEVLPNLKPFVPVWIDGKILIFKHFFAIVYYLCAAEFPLHFRLLVNLRWAISSENSTKEARAHLLQYFKIVIKASKRPS